jgi:hypothetical protein
MTQTFFANILLFTDMPFGKQGVPTRKKKDWFHSISVLGKSSIYKMKIGDIIKKCMVIHFYGEKGGPVLDTTYTDIYCDRIHKGEKIYKLSSYEYSYGVIGDLRIDEDYEKGYGECNYSIDNIINIAYKKWGYEKIPYAHQKGEGYNCVAFVDDILSICKYGKWSKRIERVHDKYKLYI